MVGDWKDAKLMCPNCKRDVLFRYTFKKAQFRNGNHWEDISKSASIVLCTACGGSVFIDSIKEKAEL